MDPVGTIKICPRKRLCKRTFEGVSLSARQKRRMLADGVEPSSAARVLVCFVEGMRWSAKRHRHGSRREPPLRLFSTASSGEQPMYCGHGRTRCWLGSVANDDRDPNGATVYCAARPSRSLS